jgi:hypothetical protein
MFGSETHTSAAQLIDHVKSIITSQMDGYFHCFYEDLMTLLSVSLFVRTGIVKEVCTMNYIHQEQ